MFLKVQHYETLGDISAKVTYLKWLNLPCFPISEVIMRAYFEEMLVLFYLWQLYSINVKL